MYIADLHIHSKYSRATAADCDAPHLDLWARRKGIGLVGTGDFTHPAWRNELKEMLEPAEDGLYRLRSESLLPDETAGEIAAPRFVVSGEISTIYSAGGKTRKVHHVILLPGLEAAEELAHRLEAVGNIHSDGRPILGMDSRDLLRLTMDTCPEAVFIPAHIWTPHFSLFGAFSQFSTLEECYGDMSPCIHALETGLSSDPLMNRMVSQLDGYTLVSNSDAHSPAKLGREANVLDTEMNYAAMKRAIETGEGFAGTIEFYPEEGKYHLDGHRNCHVCLEPEETLRLGGRCPVCGRKLTVGVLNRVTELADRVEPLAGGKPFESLMPLPELLADCMGVSPASKKVQAAYMALLKRCGNEFSILREMPLDMVEKEAGFALGEALRRLRAGKVIRQAGYDGEYGRITVFEPGELEMLQGQTSLFGLAGVKPPKKKMPAYESSTTAESASEEETATKPAGLNAEQKTAVESDARITAVVAGPGTGKTFTLVERIAYMVEEKGVSPKNITAVTFTRQAAREMLARLESRLGAKQAKGLTIGTFHGVALRTISKKPLVSRETARAIMEELLRERGEKASAAAQLDAISRMKNGLPAPELLPGIKESYAARLQAMGVRDLDDILVEALESDCAKMPCFRHLLVDEYQDINPLQHLLARHWMGESLFVIGDPDQSIYGFRGADARCFERLSREYPETRRIVLRQNYRSAPGVLEAALSVIGRNAGEERQLAAFRPVGEPVRLMQAEDAYSEAVWIAKEIAAMTGGVDMLAAHGRREQRKVYRAFSDIAVLCRTHRQLETIERCLAHDDIPCTVTGREDFWEDSRVRSLLGFFRWLTDRQDRASLQEALLNLWKCPEPLCQRAVETACGDTVPDMEEMNRLLNEWEVLGPWLRATEEFGPLAAKQKPRKLLASLAERVGCTGKNVEKLLNASVFHSRMEDLLADVDQGQEADRSRQAAGNMQSGAVRLMTLHGAKGLEFPVVFVAGVNAGDLPLQRENDPADEEEERRLFFVGITRARDELILSSGGEPSPFLGELPEGIWAQPFKSRRPQVRMEQLSLF